MKNETPYREGSLLTGHEMQEQIQAMIPEFDDADLLEFEGPWLRCPSDDDLRFMISEKEITIDNQYGVTMYRAQLE